MRIIRIIIYQNHVRKIEYDRRMQFYAVIHCKFCIKPQGDAIEPSLPSAWPTGRGISILRSNNVGYASKSPTELGPETQF